MIVKSSIFKTNLPNYKNKRLFLFYGPNSGKVDSFADITKQSIKIINEKISVVNISQEELNQEGLENIFLKYNSLDIFGNSNVLVFSGLDTKLFKGLKENLQNKMLINVFLILKFEQLPKNNEIRLFFEENDNCICVPCYEETSIEKTKIIEEVFKKENIEINDNNIRRLAEKFSGHRHELTTELEKIVVQLKASGKNISELFIQVESLLHTGELDFVFQITSSDKSVVTKAINEMLLSKTNEIKIINLLSSHFIKILNVKSKVLNGANIDQALSSLKPQIFFKYTGQFKEQVNKWKLLEIYEILKQFYFCQSYFIKGSLTAKHRLMFLILKIVNK